MRDISSARATPRAMTLPVFTSIRAFEDAASSTGIHDSWITPIHNDLVHDSTSVALARGNPTLAPIFAEEIPTDIIVDKYTHWVAWVTLHIDGKSPRNLWGPPERTPVCPRSPVPPNMFPEGTAVIAAIKTIYGSRVYNIRITFADLNCTCVRQIQNSLPVITGV